MRMATYGPKTPVHDADQQFDWRAADCQDILDKEQMWRERDIGEQAESEGRSHDSTLNQYFKMRLTCQLHVQQTDNGQELKVPTVGIVTIIMISRASDQRKSDEKAYILGLSAVRKLLYDQRSVAQSRYQSRDKGHGIRTIGS